MAVDHVAGTTGIWEVKGQEEGVRLGAQLFDGFQSGAGERLPGLSQEVSNLLAAVVWRLRLVDIPDLLRDGRK